MKILAIIQGLSIATILLVAGLPAYGASIPITVPAAQLDDDPILDIAGRPGDTITWEGFIDTTGLTANLQSLTAYAIRATDEIPGFEIEGEDTVELQQFFPNFSTQFSVDPNAVLDGIFTGYRSGPPGLPPNYFGSLVSKVTITLGDQLNNDGQVDYRIGISSAIDANGKDVTDQFNIFEFEVQPASVPEPSSIFGLVIAGGFGVFFRKQNRKVQA
ncbi:PEP-CTERM sorting domain-containing protein [Nostoc sp. UHCC 0702]|nr:PEP-CTERM sorting domain-containing protein [Nostoc sp. UHCC 0702]